MSALLKLQTTTTGSSNRTDTGPPSGTDGHPYAMLLRRESFEGRAAGTRRLPAPPPGRTRRTKSELNRLGAAARPGVAGPTRAVTLPDP